ncbi:MAG: rhodanese-like domain-containing protein [Aureliella sp.]|jgi:rhodanese-related sulfurtransferase
MASTEPLEVDVATVSKWLDERPEVALLDCREPAEAAIAKIDRAVLIPMSQWADAGSRLQELEGKHVVVMCHHGGRSLRVTQWLRANGFPDAQSMAGGIDAWALEIDPSTPRY